MFDVINVSVANKGEYTGYVYMDLCLNESQSAYYSKIDEDYVGCCGNFHYL